MIPRAARALMLKIDRSKARKISMGVIEPLESRVLMSFYDVTTAVDNFTGTVTTAGHAGTQADPYQATTLRAAISAAAGNVGADTIVFDPSAFPAGSLTTILLGSVINVNDTGGLTIQGPGAGQVAISGNSHVNLLTAKGTLNISGITLTDGLTHGDVIGGGPAKPGHDDADRRHRIELHRHW